MSLKSSCSSLRTPHRPMPDKDALYRSFNQLLGSLDLPDDKIEEMNSYDDHKKWDILCSRNLMKVHQSPSFYLQRLRSHVGLKGAQSKTDVTEMLRGLEVSLRTYSIEWLRNFLSESHSLDTLVELIDNVNLSSENFQILTQGLRVIISDSSGFEMAINHPKLLDALVKSLSTVSTKNRCNVLQLLALAAEKSEKGHERILKSLKSNGGIEKLMNMLTLDNKTDQMVIVSTLNLINTVVNSPLDLNYRVYLQFEFRQIGFAARSERLMLNESSLMSEVIDEIKNYQSMIINVNQLAKDRAEVGAFDKRLKKSESRLMDVEKQSINGERSSEVAKKDGPAEMSERCKVDKLTPDADQRPEILLKSTVRIAPMIKADSELRITERAVLQTTPPPPPPPKMALSIKKKVQARCKLPSLNWLPLRPNQVRGTIFNDLNDERLRKIINFTHFEDKFCIADMSKSPRDSPLTNRIRTPSYVSLLESTRLRNIAIVLRKLNFDADVVIEAINDYDFNQLNLDSVQLLTNLAPKDSETEAYRSYTRQKKDVGVLSEEDKFLLKLSQVERLTTKLFVMDFMGNFNDRTDSFKIQLCAITSASLSLKSSKKFKSVLEIILTFGNYMNSHKSSGSAYGFRLKGTFERLNDTRSNDKKFSLFEYMVTETIAKNFPQLLTLDSELLCISEAARISISSISSEVASMQSGWRKLTEESKLSKSSTLRAFETTSSEKFNKLINELKAAHNNYNECARYFGEESSPTTDSDEFFSIVSKFMSQFKVLSAKVKL